MSTQPSAGMGGRARDLAEKRAGRGAASAAGSAADHHAGGSRSDEGRAGDRLTRDKLIEAAGHVFAERGYQGATVREICRLAGANVASVNYTFGDKMGLYTEVLRQSMRSKQTAAFTRALESETPEKMIRAVIKARLESLLGEGRGDWAYRIMLHEFAQPTPAMARVIEEFRPIYERTSRAVGEIIGLPAEHITTRLCMNSIVGQFLYYKYVSPCFNRLQPELLLTPETLDGIAEHIYEFSMAYLRHVRAQQGHARAQQGNAAAARNGSRRRNVIRGKSQAQGGTDD